MLNQIFLLSPFQLQIAASIRNRHLLTTWAIIVAPALCVVAHDSILYEREPEADRQNCNGQKTSPLLYSIVICPGRYLRLPSREFSY